MCREAQAKTLCPALATSQTSREGTLEGRD